MDHRRRTWLNSSGAPVRLQTAKELPDRAYAALASSDCPDRVQSRHTASDALPGSRHVRGIPTEIGLDQEHGVDTPCAASFDILQPVRKTFLTSRIGSLPLPRQEICRTLAAMADC